MTSSPSSASRSVEIGRIGRAHGLLGEVRVKLFWEDSSTLFEVDEVLLVGEQGKRPARIENVRPADKAVLLKLEGVNDRTAAEALKGLAIAVPRAALPEPEAGEYYLVDLIGAELRGPDGPIGVVVEVRTHPSVDVAVVKLPDGRLAEQVLADQWLSSVDVAAGVIEVTSRDGLLI